MKVLFIVLILLGIINIYASQIAINSNEFLNCKIPDIDNSIKGIQLFMLFEGLVEILVGAYGICCI